MRPSLLEGLTQNVGVQAKQRQFPCLSRLFPLASKVVERVFRWKHIPTSWCWDAAVRAAGTVVDSCFWLSDPWLTATRVHFPACWVSRVLYGGDPGSNSNLLNLGHTHSNESLTPISHSSPSGSILYHSGIPAYTLFRLLFQWFVST